MQLGDEKPLVSVIMPTYNVKQYVGEAVESILNQTYENLEFVIVDDGSTDGTYEILIEYAKKDSRIKLYRNDTNKKICYTLNRGFELSSGKLILRMDGDDISTPNRLEILYEFLKENPSVDLVGSNVVGINEKGEVIGQHYFLHTDRYIRRCHKYKSGVSHFWLAKRKVYDVLQGYRNVPSCEDYDFLLRCNILGFKLANVKDFVYKNRIREGNTATTLGLIQILRVKYIQKLHKKEKTCGIRKLDEEELKNATNCSETQRLQYAKSIKYLDIAVRNKSNIIKCCGNLFKAVCASRFITKYLIIAVIYRMLLIEEKIYEKVFKID